MPGKRVLWLFEYPSLNGGEHSLLATLPYLREADFEIHALAPPAGPLAGKLQSLGVPITAWQPADNTGSSLSQAAKREHLRRYFSHWQPALIHANSLSMTRTAAPVARSLQMPCIGHLRDILRISKTAYADLNQASLLLAVSKAVKTWHTAAGLREDITRVVYNGVDTQRFQPQPPDFALHRQFNVPQDAFVLGAVGQIGMRKGLDTLLAAAEIVAGQMPQMHLVIAGQRHSTKAEAIAYEQALHQKATRPPLAGRVTFAGVIDDMPGFYRNINVLVHAANQEPLGRVLLEAAACGKPVVATAVGGTREIFPTAEARLIPAKDPHAIAAALLEVMESDNLRRQMGERARQRVVDAFNICTAGPALSAVYNAAAAHK